MINSARRVALAGVLAAGLVAFAGPSASPADPADPADPAVQLALVDGRLEVHGSPGPDTVSITLDPAGSDALEIFTRSSPVPDFRVPRSAVTRGIEVSLASGDDSFSVVETGGVFTTTTPVRVEGGDGADHLTGGSGGETLLGGAGADLAEGRGGPDQIILGDAADTVVWTADDGDDIVDGGSGADRALIRGADTGDLLEVSNVGGGVSVSPGSSTAAEFTDVESVVVEPLTGSDKVVLGDLTGTGVRDVVTDFAPTVGGGVPDHVLDTLVIQGTGTVEPVNLSGTAGLVDVTGLSATIHLRNADPRYPHDDSDLLAIDTGTGTDEVTAFGISPDAIRFVVG